MCNTLEGCLKLSQIQTTIQQDYQIITIVQIK